MKQQYLKICIGTCTDPGIFIRGSRSICHLKISDNVFCLFLVLNFFKKSNGLFQRKLKTFQGSRGALRGSNIFSRGWGVQPFSTGEWGVQLLIPLRNPYNLCFSRGSGSLVQPSESAHSIFGSTGCCDKI